MHEEPDLAFLTITKLIERKVFDTDNQIVK